MLRGGSRVIFLSLILGIHVLLAWVLLRETAFRLLRPLAPQSLVVEAISASVIDKARPPPDATLLHEAPRPPPLREVIPLQIAPFEVESQPITPATTDWSSEASAAAADVLERARRKAAENHSGHAPDATDASGKSGVFGSEEQNHRAGTVEGGSRFWVTDNCYYDFPRGLPPPSRLAGEFHLLTRICKPTPTGGGGKMFDDLKPQYLRPSPPAPAR